MENQKNNKIVIVLLIVIIVILLGLCALFATGTISFKSNDVDNNELNNDDINEDVDDNYLKFVIDNENKVNQCHSISKNNYHSYEKSYAVIINNISIKNKKYTFKYDENLTNRTRKISLNNNVVSDGNISEALLLDVCVYGNYIVYSMGWEGPPYYRIINTNGEEIMSFKGNKVTYSNGILSVEELEKNDIDNINDNELIKYQLNMNSENLEKENITTEKYVCDPNGTGYDC